MVDVWQHPREQHGGSCIFFLLSFTSSRLLYLPDTGSSSGAARGGWGSANLPPSFFAVPTVGRRWVGLLEEVSKWEELGSPTGKPCKFLALPSLSSPRGTQCFCLQHGILSSRAAPSKNQGLVVALDWGDGQASPHTTIVPFRSGRGRSTRSTAAG